MQSSNKQQGGFAKGNTFGNRWPKGVSGNPKGRPRMAILSDVLRQKLVEEMPGASEKTIANAIADSLVEKAIGGDVPAIKEIFDRIEGKSSQLIDVEMKVEDWRSAIEDYGIQESEILDVARQLLSEGLDTESAS